MTEGSQPSLHGELLISRTYADLPTEALQEKARHYTWLERDPTLVPRQRQAVETILGRLVFELTMRRRDGEG